MAQANLDSLGKTYIGLAIAWTFTLFAGMAFLWYHRRLPCLQIRRLSLVFLAVSPLHAYGTVCLIAYIIAPLAPCTAEYWMMSIWLPFGIAMFHASNSQFLHVASRQKQFARINSLDGNPPVNEDQAERLANSRFHRIIRGVERADRVKRTMIWIGAGLIVQLLLTFFFYFGSRKFHPSYGIFNVSVQGTTYKEIRAECSKGWEWWLSIVWQFFWAWIYAPYLLWKSRSIRDVHGWRLQTVCCCLAGLPASPLWLAGLYAPGMAPVNRYVVPPTWFALSIFFMEETLDAIALWERRQKFEDNSKSSIEGSNSFSKNTETSSYLHKLDENGTGRRPSQESHKSDMFTMAALENALRLNAEPLLQFAALKDFSGENVSFLTHVAEWQRGWFVSTGSTQQQRHQQFVAAVRIYISFVSLEWSEFPINIGSREMKHLHNVFSAAAALLMRRTSMSSTTDSVTPFDCAPPDSSSTVDLKTGINLDTLGRANLNSATSRTTELGHDEVLADIQIPTSFTPEVFENATGEIKYLVLTNTWPKFVNAGYASSNAEQEERGAHWWVRRLTLCNV